MNTSEKKWTNKRTKTPTVLQMEAVECGAASLAMILAYYGRIVPLEKLRIECGVSRDGSKASNMLKAARKFGLEAKGFRKEPKSLHGLNLPMVLFWNFNHFVVLEGIKKDKVFLNDPASGPKTIPYEEFDQAFTGVALTFKPGPDFKKGGEKPSMLQSIKKRVKGYSIPLFYIIFAGLCLVIPGLVIPTFIRVFVDSLLIKKMDGMIQPLLLAMGITALMRGSLTWLQEHYLLRLETKLALSSSAKFFRHVFSLPVEFFNQRMGGDISLRVQLNDKVAQLLSGDLATNTLNIILIVFYAILMLQYDILLTCIGVITVILNLAVLKFVSTKRNLLNQKLQQENGKLMGLTMIGLQMIESLKASGAESDFYSQWSGQQAKVINAQQELAIPTQIMSVLPGFLMTLNYVLILGIGGFKVMNGALSMGMLVAFQSLMASFMTPVNQMVNLGSKLQEMKADMNRLDDVMNYQVDSQFLIDNKQKEQNSEFSGKLSGQVDLKDVSFGYNLLEPPLIQNFNLTLTPGARVALVGRSGSGKSTAAKVLSGLYKPWSGDILLDGEPMVDFPREVINHSLSMVDQDIFMFEGTIKENLTMWDNHTPDADIQKATIDACIHDDIASRPGGYYSEVEEGGANFSGGQRQRLEIARALVTNPTILILDEATSALDTNSENIVDSNLRRRGCTCLIVAHRLSTIRDCDEIIVLDHGKIVQRGTHEEMKDAQGPYAELIKDY